VPYAIGAKLAFPDRPVIAFTGDGSMSMGMGELATLAQEQLPVKIVVMRNNSLAIEAWEQNAMLGNPQFGCELAPIDFAAVAEACGVRGYHVIEPADVSKTMADVDPYEAPFADTFKPGQMQKLVTAFERGEKARQAMGGQPPAAGGGRERAGRAGGAGRAGQVPMSWAAATTGRRVTTVQRRGGNQYRTIA
jgi:pyruvate dehydrogenase (quinone)